MARDKKRRRRSRDKDTGRRSKKRTRSKGKKGKADFKYKKRGTDAWKKRAEQSGYNRRSMFKEEVNVFRPKEGDNLIRILPPTWEDAEHYGHEIWCHYGIGPDGDSFLDLQKMTGQPDPIEEERSRALQENDKEYANKLQSKKRVAVYIIDRDEEEKGIQLWSMPWSMDADITTLAVDKRTGEVLDIDDPEDGYDVEFTKTGQGIKTQYGGIAIARKSSELDNDEALEEAVELPIPETFVYYDYEEIEKAFNAGGSAYDDDDDDDEEDEEDRPRKRGKGKKEKPKRKRKKYDDDEDEDEEEEESAEYTWQAVQEMDYEDLLDVIDDENLDVEDDIDEDDEEEVDDLRNEVCDELGLEKPKKRKPKKSEKEKLRKRGKAKGKRRRR